MTSDRVRLSASALIADAASADVGSAAGEVAAALRQAMSSQYVSRATELKQQVEQEARCAAFAVLK